MTMEQFINVVEKELVPLLREKRFKSLKEATRWAHVGASVCLTGLVGCLERAMTVCWEAWQAPVFFRNSRL